MLCDDARRILNSPKTSATGEAQIASARRHVAHCDTCLASLASPSADLGLRLRRLAATTSAPPELRPRIRDALRHEVRRTRHRRRVLLTGSTAIAVAAAAALDLVVRQDSSLRRFAEPLTREARAAMAPAAMTSVTSDYAQAAAWVQMHLGYGVVVPMIADADLLGARVTTVNGADAAVIVYRYHGVPITYFALRTAPLGARAEVSDVHAYGADGYEVAWWWEGDTPRAVVAPMPRDEVVELAKQCRVTARGPMR